MADFSDRDVHLLKKALAISVLVIDRGDGVFQSASDGGDMKPGEIIKQQNKRQAHSVEAAEGVKSEWVD